MSDQTNELEKRMGRASEKAVNAMILALAIVILTWLYIGLLFWSFKFWSQVL